MACFDALLSGNQILAYAKVIVQFLYACMDAMKTTEQLYNYDNYK